MIISWIVLDLLFESTNDQREVIIPAIGFYIFLENTLNSSLTFFDCHENTIDGRISFFDRFDCYHSLLSVKVNKIQNSINIIKV